MHRLVEDLLTLSRLESSEESGADEVVDVRQLVREVADEARVLSIGRHRIEVDRLPAFVRGSREELRSAFRQPRIQRDPLHARRWPHYPRWREDATGRALRGQDTGIGIAPEHLSRLTERFYRVDKSRSRETGGTGLGLAIAKHVLLRHDGRLEIASEIGKGSTFSAVLPASA